MMNNNRGAALIICYLVIAVFTIFVSAMMVGGVTESRVAQRFVGSTQGFWLADAGIQRALWELNDNNCTGFVQEGTATACTSCDCGGVDKTLAATLSSAGDYDLTLDSDNTVITSIGSYPDRTAANKVERSIQVDIAGGGSSLFNYGAFAKGAISMSNSARVDSYDSTDGDYGGDNVNSNGDVGTNGTSSGIITMSNTATIDGDASTGEGGTVSTFNTADVTGTETHSNAVTLDSATVPSELSALSSSGNLFVWGSNTQTLPAGNYKYSMISLSNSAKLTITGDVKIYATSALALLISNSAEIILDSGASLTVYSDGIVMLSNSAKINDQEKSPDKFTLHSTYTGSNGVMLSNSTKVYGGVYAPDTSIPLSNSAAVYGAVVAKSMTISNSAAVHYDENLAASGGGGGSGSYTSSNWQEI